MHLDREELGVNGSVEKFEWRSPITDVLLRNVCREERGIQMTGTGTKYVVADD